MDIYLMNVIRPTRLVTPHLRAAGGGAIVNISSFAAVEPDPVFPTSAVFRAGLAAFSKLYADQYAKDGIRMNNVLPGFIDSLPEKEDRRARIPAGRYGKSEEVASLIAGWRPTTAPTLNRGRICGWTAASRAVGEPAPVVGRTRCPSALPPQFQVKSGASPR